MTHAGTHPDNVAASAYQPGLHWYCVLMVVAVLLLISAGGMVTSTGSGLSVPDWPTTYGYNMFTYPPSKWTGGIFYEHTHRLIASTVGMLTIGLVVWMYLRERRSWVRRMSYLALVTVILQGILGGLTVRYLLPTPISVFHGCLAQAFLCLVTSLAIFTSRTWVMGRPRVETSSRLALPMLATTCVVIVFLQLIVGAIMRHTGSGLAVPDFPLAYGQIAPRLDEASLAQYNTARAWDYQLPSVSRDQIIWHLLHRAWAIVVALNLLTMSGLGWFRHRNLASLARPACLIALLVPAQIALGAWTVLSGRQPLVATLHVAVGAANLAATLALAISSRRLLIVAAPQRVPAAAMAGVRA